jgi:hypothetical protein
MRAASIAIAWILLFVGVAFSAEPMAPKDIKVTFFNGQPFNAASLSGTKYKMTFMPAGTMMREPLAQSGAKTSGTWKLSANGFCTTWQHGRPNCFTLVPSGDNRWSVQKIATTIETAVAVWSK